MVLGRPGFFFVSRFDRYTFAWYDCTNMHKVIYTVPQLMGLVLADKQQHASVGRIAPETLNAYQRELSAFSAWAGHVPTTKLTPQTFTDYRRLLEKRLGLARQATVIAYIRAAFSHAVKQGWTDEPVYGLDFVPPAVDPDSLALVQMRAGLDEREDPALTRTERDWLVANSTGQLKAMILIGLNLGMGPTDVARLKWKHINMESGRLSLRRMKTGARREAWLWPETREAIKAVATTDPAPDAFVFLTRFGRPWVRREIIGGKPSLNNSLTREFTKLVKKGRAAGAINRPAKLTFYSLRHTYFTAAEGYTNLNTVNRTMGHALAGKGRWYSQRKFPLKRLRKLARFVHRKLRPQPPAIKLSHEEVKDRVYGYLDGPLMRLAE